MASVLKVIVVALNWDADGFMFFSQFGKHYLYSNNIDNR